jgi:hypothetical protein
MAIHSFTSRESIIERWIGRGNVVNVVPDVDLWGTYLAEKSSQEDPALHQLQIRVMINQSIR